MRRPSRGFVLGAVGGMLALSLMTGPLAFGDPAQPPGTPSASPTPARAGSPTPARADSPTKDPADSSGTGSRRAKPPTGDAAKDDTQTGGSDPSKGTSTTTRTKSSDEHVDTKSPKADGAETQTTESKKVENKKVENKQVESSKAAGPQAGAQAAARKSITLKVAAKDTPIKGRFFQGIGSYGFSGTLTPAKKHQRVEIWWSGGKVWKRFTHTYTSSGKWSVSKVVNGPGVRYFYATLGDHNPTSSKTIRSSKTKVTIEKTSLKITAKSSIDSLKSTKVSGTVWPARPHVKVHFQVKSSKGYQDEGVVRSDSSGRVSFTFSTGKGNLKTYRLRTRYWIYRSQEWRNSPSITVKRARVLNADVTRTTKAEVAKTWHKGCPVGRSALRTIKMNYEGFDHKMHRGIMIVRHDRTKSVIAAFGKNLGRPIRRMDNPNKWNGNDPQQMEADNTSAFNCRKVTGNPYAQSPHSYGIAIDINTRENPYRDVNGKWWPKSGKKYIKRSPWKPGMLTKTSVLTKQLRQRGYFWGALWYPGRDYQHFEYDK